MNGLTRRGFAAADDRVEQLTGTGAPAPAAPVTGSVVAAPAPAPAAPAARTLPPSTTPAAAPAAAPAPAPAPAAAPAVTAAPAAPGLDPAEVGRWRKSHEELQGKSKQLDTVVQNNTFLTEKLETERKARETDAARLAVLEAQIADLTKAPTDPEIAEQLGDLLAPAQKLIQASIDQALKGAPKPLSQAELDALVDTRVQTRMAESGAVVTKRGFHEAVRAVPGYTDVMNDEGLYDFIKADPIGLLPIWDAAVKAGESNPALRESATKAIASIVGQYVAAKAGTTPTPPVITAPSGAPSVPNVIQDRVESPADIRRGAYTP